MKLNARILKSIKSLPAFPVTIKKVNRMISNSDYSARELAAVVKYDQSITANILRMCNSAYFGLRHKVDNVQDAVLYLGRDNLVRAVLAAGISRYFKKTKGYEVEGIDLWEHSVSVALMAQILSRKIYDHEDPKLFTAAILHDVGKVVLGEYVRESCKKIKTLVSEKGYDFIEAEEEVLGINHAQLGGEMALLWNFPAEIKDAIAWHHRPDLVKRKINGLVWLIYLADQICLMTGIGGGADGLAYRGLKDAFEKFKLRQQDVEEAMILLLRRMEDARELLEIVPDRRRVPKTALQERSARY
jgi:putative nucleotidyltransferase with HDIG domain